MRYFIVSVLVLASGCSLAEQRTTEAPLLPYIALAQWGASSPEKARNGSFPQVLKLASREKKNRK